MISEMALTDQLSKNETALIMNGFKSFGFITLMIVFSLVVFIAVLGNVLVVVSVRKFPRLKSQLCFHILASLAIADICVCLMVLPLSMINFSLDKWPFGFYSCLVYMSFDVMFCTASILHLCLVAFDRYLAISQPLTYSRLITPRKIKLSISVAWITSLMISFIPIFKGWFRKDFSMSNHHTWTQAGFSDECNLDVNAVYAIISSITSFYFPFFIICGLYTRIVYIATKKAKQIRKEMAFINLEPKIKSKKKQTSLCCLPKYKTDNCGKLDETQEAGSHTPKTVFVGQYQLKAVKTVGLLVGCFLVCWLPFFLIYLIKPLCEHCYIPVWLDILAVWIGYVNSAMNPFLYCYLQKEFRAAFKKLWFNFLDQISSTFSRKIRNTSNSHNEGNISTALYLNTYVSINQLLPVSTNTSINMGKYDSDRRKNRHQPPIVRRTQPNSIYLH